MVNPWLEPRLAANLEYYFEALWRQGAPGGTVLVGEALGYRGGVQTGIPFSSAGLLRSPEHPFLCSLAPRLSFDGAQAETSAAVVWQGLGSVRALPLFWNAFPWHPHRDGDPQSNRRPRASELSWGQPFLLQLLDIFQCRQMVGVGRAGEQALQAACPDREVGYLRHPSHGGRAAFLAGLGRLFDGAGDD
jgi:hypothetical protein